ncbi:hypothetical protein SH501x_001865 [Pirellulaceae bacterium SH501]
MVPRRLVIMMFCFVFCLLSVARGENSAVFDEAIARCAKQSERYSVLAMMDSIQEKDGEDSEDSHSVYTRYMRVVQSNKDQRKRMDLVKISLASNAQLYESVLRLGNGKSLISFGTAPGQFGEGGTNAVKRFNPIASFDLPATPLSDGNALLAGLNLYSTTYPKRTDLKQSTEKNGDLVVTTVLPGNLTLGSFRFRKVEDVWLPIELQWFISSDGSLVDVNSASLEPNKKWKLVLSTETRWKKIETHGFVPWHVKYASGMEKSLRRFDELLFTEWKFGDEIDVSLLDEKKFTSAEIKKAFELEKWKAKFEEWKP